MEEAPGIQLGELWNDMEIDGKIKLVEDLVAIEKKLLSVSFTKFVVSK